MKFKQYFWDSFYGKTICCLVEGTASKVHKLEEKSYDYSISDFNRMDISFCSADDDLLTLEKDDAKNEKPIGFKYDCDEQDDFWFTQNYGRIIRGKVPEWIPVLVGIPRKSEIMLVYFHAEAEGKDFSSAERIQITYLPHDISIRISIESNNLEYIIRNNSTKIGEMDLVVEEYQKSNLIQTSMFGEDEDGAFELIEEA